MKRMCCLCCKKSKDIDTYTDIDTDTDTDTCKFTDMTNTEMNRSIRGDSSLFSTVSTKENREVNQSISGDSSLFSAVSTRENREVNQSISGDSSLFSAVSTRENTEVNQSISGASSLISLENTASSLISLENTASSLISLENTASSLISREIEFLFELKKIQCILKGNDRLFNIDKLYHLFKQSIIKYDNSTKDFNEIAFAILHEIIQLNSVQNNLLVAINQKIESHAKYLDMKQNEEEIIEKTNIYLQELKKIIDTVTNRDIYVYAKKKEKYAMLYMDKVSQITWKANLEYNFALTSYNTAFSIFTSKKDVIIGIIEQLLKKA